MSPMDVCDLNSASCLLRIMPDNIGLLLGSNRESKAEGWTAVFLCMPSWPVVCPATETAAKATDADESIQQNVPQQKPPKQTCGMYKGTYKRYSHRNKARRFRTLLSVPWSVAFWWLNTCNKILSVRSGRGAQSQQGKKAHNGGC